MTTQDDKPLESQLFDSLVNFLIKKLDANTASDREQDLARKVLVDLGIREKQGTFGSEGISTPRSTTLKKPFPSVTAVRPEAG